jgi:hypothetical protein
MFEKLALFAGIAVIISGAAYGLNSDSIDLSSCHSMPLESCDTRCAAGCERILMDNPADTRAYYKLAVRALNSPGGPFMPEVDTNLRFCSYVGADESALCEILYAAITAYPDKFSIKGRPANSEAALAWVEQAGARNNAEARMALATFLALGEGAEYPDLKRAYRLLNSGSDVKPARQFALLHAMLLENGWGGTQNVLEADYYSKLGYSWYRNPARRSLSRTDNVFLEMIIKFGYLMGDAKIIHETAWSLSVSKFHPDSPEYTPDNLEDLLDTDDDNSAVVTDFCGREFLAVALGSEDAGVKAEEIEEIIRKYDGEDIIQAAKKYAEEQAALIMENRQMILRPRIADKSRVSSNRKKNSRRHSGRKSGLVKSIFNTATREFRRAVMR